MKKKKNGQRVRISNVIAHPDDSKNKWTSLIQKLLCDFNLFFRANVEIARVRTGYEKEIAALKAKLSKAEVSNKSLKTMLEAKVSQSSPLSKKEPPPSKKKKKKKKKKKGAGIKTTRK